MIWYTYIISGIWYGYWHAITYMAFILYSNGKATTDVMR